MAPLAAIRLLLFREDVKGGIVKQGVQDMLGGGREWQAGGRLGMRGRRETPARDDFGGGVISRLGPQQGILLCKELQGSPRQSK